MKTSSTEAASRRNFGDFADRASDRPHATMKPISSMNQSIFHDRWRMPGSDSGKKVLERTTNWRTESHA